MSTELIEKKKYSITNFFGLPNLFNLIILVPINQLSVLT